MRPREYELSDMNIETEITISKEGKNNKKWIWICVGMGTALLIIGLSILFRALRKRKYVLRGNYIFLQNMFLIQVKYHLIFYFSFSHKQGKKE
jgi:hypothetical protein